MAPGARPSSGALSAAASPATVAWVNSARGETSVPKAVRSRDATRMARIESPPRAKKLSVAPASSTWRISAHTRATVRSASVRGAIRSALAAKPSGPGAGSAARSSLPLAVSGSAASGTNAAGTICAGSDRWRNWRSSAALGGPAGPAATTWATSRRTPGWSSRAATTASAIRGWAVRAASISPGSIRKPRIFTWSSARPRYSSRPSASHRARSPVRYIRLPAGPYGSATNRDAVSPGRRR
ncbi:hypothetical protein Shyhy02_08930 [Streptomyces hygroscopicus subsp. hygroscopicus]|nr:hypothetical protein Shyhy02_08930 [Streptomyces hygroscopicus subsp. hygroscopicus]